MNYADYSMFSEANTSVTADTPSLPEMLERVRQIREQLGPPPDFDEIRVSPDRFTKIRKSVGGDGSDREIGPCCGVQLRCDDALWPYQTAYYMRGRPVRTVDDPGIKRRFCELWGIPLE